jgi:hypothetical protein
MSTLDPKIESLLKEQDNKYFELVWYARNVIGIGCEPSTASAPDISERYPNETAELHSDYPDWAHGFNSGCLAMVRLIMGATYVMSTEDRIQEALDEFPFLDT